ncbi:MAG: hypothetical protein WBM71_02070 [Sedimenticolaceae bacterium]
MAGMFLLIAGIFEWGWSIDLKLGWVDGRAHWVWITFSVFAMVVSGSLLLLGVFQEEAGKIPVSS